MPGPDEMWRIILAQQERIEALEARLAASETLTQATEQRFESVDARIEATASFVEDLATPGESDSRGAGGWHQRTQLGGYGEMHLTLGDDSRIDFHRWVMFVGHEFSERIRFFSEVELEHSIAGEGKKGEIELEQAFVEFDLDDSTKAKVGLFILPVGLLNETHEPTTFYGVERNIVEKEIIPTTWWEGGVGLAGQGGGGLSYDIAVHSGLRVPTSGGKAFNIRSGRQKVAEADASKGAVTGRLKFTGLPGFAAAASLQYQQDITQGALAEAISATLFTAHADWRRGPFGLRALYARWDLNGAAPAAIGADQQVGYYVEPSYRFGTVAGEVGLFARYTRCDVAAGDDLPSANAYFDLGFNYWPHERVVLKADLQFTDFAGNSDDDESVNLGIGYVF